MNKQTPTNTAPVTQNDRIIVASIFPQFDATGVHHQGLQKWKMMDAMIIIANITATNTCKPTYKFSDLLFTTFVVSKQCSKICWGFFS